ncbi:MAG: class IV adenylate cyclase [Candidatus Heimdallarchaeota archaeon]
MPIEVEVKLKIADLNELEMKLVEKGAILEEIVNQRDQYFNHPSKDFSETDEALRIREDGDRIFLTYKGPKFDPKSKTRIEIDLKVENAQQLSNLLEKLNFEKVAIVSKERRIYLLDGMHFCLDNVASIGTYLEVEKIISDKSFFEKTRKEIFRALKALKLDPKKNIRKSYLELLLEKSDTK